MDAKQVMMRLSLAVLLTVATAHATRAQQVVAVFFEELGFGSAMSYVFTIHSTTNAAIGYRTTFHPQGRGTGITTSFAWESTDTSLTLTFATTVDFIAITGYDPSIDVVFFTRPPGYWAGCQSPYIPVGIPTRVVNELCALLP